MKRLLTAIITAALCLGLFSAAFAAGEQRVFDYADLLTDDEEQALESRIEELVSLYSQDIGLVTIEDDSVTSTMEFADAFYEDSGMGAGDNRTGVLYCIDMYNREAYISTAGDMIDIIDDQREEVILDTVVYYLAEEDYYSAFMGALDYTEEYINAGVEAGHYGYDEETGEVMDPSEYGSTYVPDTPATAGERAATAAIMGGGGGLVGLAAGAIAKGSIKKSNAKKFKPPRYDRQSTSSHDLQVNDSKLVNKFVTTRVIPRNNNNNGSRSGGGGVSTSGVHMSSGGMHHGGGGRKF